MNLGQVGIIPRGYRTLRPRVAHLGILTHPSSKPIIGLKLYELHSPDQTSSEGYTARDMRNFLVDSIETGIIVPRTGLGFAILSKDNLNVAQWDKKYPIIIANDLFEFTRADEHLVDFRKVNIAEQGAFCMWELGVANHEREAWNRYLHSRKREIDKLTYLDDRIEGDL